MKRTLLTISAMTLASAVALASVPVLAMSTNSTPAAQQTDYFKEAKKLVDAKQYNKAIPLLKQSLAEQGDNADTLNLLGFSYRKSGDQMTALDYYTKALAKEPKHLGANEYLGELYLEMKMLPKAEERQAVLKDACGSCDELNELTAAIDDYKKVNGAS
jgi:tetratricopeptide (TPR) repeat protein